MCWGDSEGIWLGKWLWTRKAALNQESTSEHSSFLTHKGIGSFILYTWMSATFYIITFISTSGNKIHVPLSIAIFLSIGYIAGILVLSILMSCAALGRVLLWWAVSSPSVMSGIPTKNRKSSTPECTFLSFHPSTCIPPHLGSSFICHLLTTCRCGQLVCSTL